MKIVLFGALSTLLCACAMAPHDGGPIEKLPIPLVFKETDPRWIAAKPAETQPRGEWWKAFSDPILDELIARAEGSNTNLRQAEARLNQARALVRGADAGRSVQASANATASRQGGNLINAAGANGTLITTSLNLSYETDFFGKLAKTSDAVLLDAKSREALAHSVRLAVLTDVAQAYFALRGLDMERGTLNRAHLAQLELLRLSTSRARAGLAPSMDVERSQGALASVEAELAGLDRQRAQIEHALAVLVGAAASEFSLPAQNWTGVLPTIPPGIPSTLLGRRPDVSAAFATALAAQARVGAARAAWFPSLSLTASGGYASPELSDIFRVSLLDWAIGAALSLPVFDGGKREASLNASAAEMELQVAVYREQILVAFRDVEDQLSALRLLSDQATAQGRVATSFARVADMSDSRYRNGLTNRQEVLDARQNEWQSRRKEAQIQASQFQATVGLVKALGGSW